ncbi:MAG TPA: hypothetical protein VHH88_08160, partial [Verrucomicrobiae bacterium]|nr:hypothetical protein [Verrucomicrobiae bacterium]
MIRWQIKVVCAVAVTLAAAAALGWFLSGRQSHAPSPANEITLDAAPTLPVPEAHSRMNPLHSNAPRDFPSRLSDALGLSDPQRRSIEFGTLFQQWLAEDSPSAVNWLRTMHRGNEFTEGLTLALNQMSPASPEQAVALANELASEPPQKHLFNLVFSEIAAKDPQRAVSLLDQTQGGARVNAVRALASTWSLSDSSAALDWAETLSPSQGRAAAIESVLSIMASSDPEAALRAAQLDLDPGELSAVIDQAIGPLLQKVDYATAKDLIEQLPT